MWDDDEGDADDELQDWRDGLLLTEKGAVRRSQHNVNLILSEHRAWSGVIRFNAFKDKVITVTRPPWASTEGDPDWKPGQEWSDLDDARLRSWLARVEGVEPSLDLCRSGVDLCARHNSFNPLTEHLLGLEWDGARRVDRWLSTYCMAPDTEHNRLAGRWWLLSAVARALDPGCQVDHAIVLEGTRQGEGKSTALRVLAGDDYYHGTRADIANKDSLQALHGVWIVELGELDGITTRRAVEDVKDFLSGRVDRYRPPYGRRVIDYPRTCVFAGTVNGREYLLDTTGNRRFWPIVVGDRIDLEALRRDREQLWAEAVACYEDGARWHPETVAEKQLMGEEVDARVIEDSWVAIIADWLTSQGPLFEPTVGDLLGNALKLDPRDHTRGASGRVGKIMQQLGWLPAQVRRGGSRIRVYRRPES